MYRVSCVARVAGAVAVAIAVSVAAPVRCLADEFAAYWAVTGVASDDTLNLRDVPSGDSKSLGQIPPNARGLKSFGCRHTELPLEVWMKMNKTERQGAQTRWCRIEYRGKQGWVAARFLKKDGGPAR